MSAESRIEVADAAPGVRVIAFNRPEVRNAFDTAMYIAVTGALAEADADPSVNAVVLTGRGKGFTSGQDLAEMAAIATGTAVEGAGQGFAGLLDCVNSLAVPLLAAVNGVAVGLGFTLLAHCDLVLVDAEARLRVPFTELGVPPEAASSFLFPAAMGPQQAARVLLTSDWVGAEELVRLGLALRVCAPGTVLDETVALAARIASYPRGATRASVSLMRRGAPRRGGRGQPARAGRLRRAARRRRLARHPGRVRRAAGPGRLTVRLAVTVSLTDRDLSPAALAVACEERGFGGLYLPEHTHLPVREDAPPALVEGVDPDVYKRSLDPMVALGTAAAVTTRLGLGTGILLVAQHDPIVLAKQVATLDHLSGGRVTLGIGFGWNRAEAEDHGVDFDRRHAVVREHMEAMEAIWSEEQAEYHGEFVDFAPTWSWPKPAQRPRVRTLVGGGATDAVFTAVTGYADGWIPIGGKGLSEALPRLRARAEAAGRDPATLSVVPFGTIADRGKLEHYARLGVDEVVLRVRAGAGAPVEAELDGLAPLVGFAATLEGPGH